MISEAALNKACRPAILGRGQLIAHREGRIWRRRLRYDGSVTKLEGNVDSSSGYEDYYRATIGIDETADKVISYSCNCPAAARYAGPCKHSIALALDYNRNACSYEGFDELRHVSTSSVLGEYLGRLAAPPRLRALSQAEEPAGSVRVVLTLVRDRDLFARFRLVGARGTYVMRDVSAFVSNVLSGSWFEYGKRLAFTHDLGAFDESSRELVRFMVRCVQNRRSYAAERIYGRTYGMPGLGASASLRELRLSGPEADELLGLFVGREMELESDFGAGASPRRERRVLVQDGEPSLALSLVAAGDNAYELVRGAEVDFFTTGERLYALEGDRLWRCGDAWGKISGFLTGVWASPSSQLLLAGKDVPLFAATLLPKLEESLQVTAPPELEALRPSPLALEFYLDRTAEGVSCDAQAVYGGQRYHLLDRSSKDRSDLQRDFIAEAGARRLVARYFPLSSGATGLSAAGEWHALLPDKDDAAVARLVFEGVDELSRAGKVMATDAFSRLASEARPRVQLGLSVRANLINLDVSTEDLPLDELFALLASYRRRQRFHRLKDGSFVDLSKVNLDEAERLAAELGLSARQLSSGHVEVPSYKAFILDTLISDEEKDASFEEYVENFRSVDPSSFRPPASLAARLRPYQVAGYQWLSALCEMGFGGVLADEMGLGKSVQLIALLLAQRGRGSTLVVCPASLVYNWLAEFEKFAPQLDVVAVVGSASERARLRGERHEVYVSSYDLVRRDVEGWAKKPLWHEVLDEAQYIKNHETLAARAVKALDARHRLALTGTPIENRLSELWSIFDYLMPGLLGSYDRFRDRYEQPILDGDDEVAARLRAAVGPFVLRRLKSDVLKDLPEKLEQVVYARMAGRQRSLYMAHEQALRLSLAQQGEDSFDQGKLQVLAELTKLRQICCDPHLLYDDYEGPSCKLDTIMELVSSVLDAQKKMLIFSQFTSYLALIAAELDARGIAHYTITGSTPKRRRLDLVDAFNTDETPVFLISLKAGGTGLNLVGAQVVVHADPWWNAAAQDQATDRAHRIGQTSDVTVYKVIARETIEDRILALQDAKSGLADQVVGMGAGMSLASLRKEDLIDLLGE